MLREALAFAEERSSKPVGQACWRSARAWSALQERWSAPRALRRRREVGGVPTGIRRDPTATSVSYRCGWPKAREAWASAFVPVEDRGPARCPYDMALGRRRAWLRTSRLLVDDRGGRIRQVVLPASVT